MNAVTVKNTSRGYGNRLMIISIMITTANIYSFIYFYKYYLFVPLLYQAQFWALGT